jgi:hypothetical protein
MSGEKLYSTREAGVGGRGAGGLPRSSRRGCGRRDTHHGRHVPFAISIGAYSRTK